MDDPGACPGVDLEREISNENSLFSLEPDGLTLTFGGLSPDQWGQCERFGIGKEDLQKAGADMTYWESGTVGVRPGS